MWRSLSPSFMCVALGLALLPSCARQEPTYHPITSATAPIVKGCPLGVPHTHVDFVETAEGADVSFFTAAQRIAELRVRVRHQAEVRGPGQHLGTGHLGKHDLGHDHGMRLFELPPHEARAEDAPSGAVLHIAVDAAHREELLGRLKARVGRLETRSCAGW
jgi:hypothetical protein